MSTRIADQVAERGWGGAPILVAIKEAGGEAVRIDDSGRVAVTYYRFDDGSEIWVDASGDWDVVDVVEEEETPATPIEPELLGRNTYLFGAGPGWLPAEADEIARRHGARLVNAEEPTSRLTTRRCHWFVCRNTRYAGAVAEAVLRDLRAAGLLGDAEDPTI